MSREPQGPAEGITVSPYSTFMTFFQAQAKEPPLWSLHQQAWPVQCCSSTRSCQWCQGRARTKVMCSTMASRRRRGRRRRRTELRTGSLFTNGQRSGLGYTTSMSALVILAHKHTQGGVLMCVYRHVPHQHHFPPFF